MYYLFVLCFTVVLAVVNGNNYHDPENDVPHEPGSENILEADDLVLKLIHNFEVKANVAKLKNTAVIPVAETFRLNEELIKAIDGIIEALDYPTKVYKFLKNKGMERIIIPHLTSSEPQVRARVIQLLKHIFEKAPVTSIAMTPITVVDLILDIFESDFHPDVKGNILDILHLWLPDNPKVQARVMRLKGLETFYEQMKRVDYNTVHKMVAIFNNVLKEHLQARDNNQESKVDVYKLDLYKKIGLIEKISTNDVCNGLLNVYGATYDQGITNETLLATVFDVMKNVKPFCSDNYRGNMSALDIFNNFMKRVKEIEKRIAGEARVIDEGMDVLEVKEVLQDYINIVRSTLKQEL